VQYSLRAGNVSNGDRKTTPLINTKEIRKLIHGNPEIHGNLKKSQKSNPAFFPDVVGAPVTGVATLFRRALTRIPLLKKIVSSHRVL
jgi:hypothetical protein